MLREQGGKNASLPFKSITKHGDKAKAMMKDFKVGEMKKIKSQNQNEHRILMLALGILAAIFYKTFIKPYV